MDKLKRAVFQMSSDVARIEAAREILVKVSHQHWSMDENKARSRLMRQLDEMAGVHLDRILALSESSDDR